MMNFGWWHYTKLKSGQKHGKMNDTLSTNPQWWSKNAVSPINFRKNTTQQGLPVVVLSLHNSRDE
jgi:hypothetical protein